MAVGFFEAIAGDRAVAWSDGSGPGREINPSAMEAMTERYIDISREFPKPWTDETVRAADFVFTMGCGDACPIFPGKRYESWDDLPDPAGLEPEAVRPIRDDIERRVRHLLDQLGIDTDAVQHQPVSWSSVADLRPGHLPQEASAISAWIIDSCRIRSLMWA